MELKEFIKNTVSQIAQAVDELNNEQAEPTFVVNPSSVTPHNGIIRNSCSYNQTMLNFHIALTTNDKMGSTGSVGVLTGMFGLGAKVDSGNEVGAVSTISFELPVILPHG